MYMLYMRSLQGCLGLGDVLFNRAIGMHSMAYAMLPACIPLGAMLRCAAYAAGVGVGVGCFMLYGWRSAPGINAAPLQWSGP